MSETEWYYSRDEDDQQGPVSSKELHRLAESGELRPDDFVWKEGMPDWVPARKIKGLKFSAASSQPPPVRSSPDFDADAARNAWFTAKSWADDTAQRFWFLDFKFTRFISLSLISVAWVIWLVIVALGLLTWAFGGVGGGADGPPDPSVVREVTGFLSSPVGVLIQALLWTLLVRIWLEVFAVVFRIASDLQSINRRLAEFGRQPESNEDS